MNKSPIILILMVSLVVGVGCAKPDWIEQTVVTVDVTGTWVGNWTASAGSGWMRLELRQNGAKVTGDLRLMGTEVNRDGPIEGRVSGESFTFARVGTATRTTGELSVSGDTMHGTVFGLIRLTADLRRESP